MIEKRMPPAMIGAAFEQVGAFNEASEVYGWALDSIQMPAEASHYIAKRLLMRGDSENQINGLDNQIRAEKQKIQAVKKQLREVARIDHDPFPV